MLGAYFVYELHERMGLDPLLGVVLAFPAFFLPRHGDSLAAVAAAPPIGPADAGLAAAAFRALAGCCRIWAT